MDTFETAKVCELLGVARESIRMQVNRHQLLALPQGGHEVFPAFQFKDGAILRRIPEVLGTLDTDSPFTALLFLLSRNGGLRA